jgi:hypothetical protein
MMNLGAGNRNLNNRNHRVIHNQSRHRAGDMDYHYIHELILHVSDGALVLAGIAAIFSIVNSVMGHRHGVHLKKLIMEFNGKEHEDKNKES